MAQLNWRMRTFINWTPASYTTGETTALALVHPLEIVSLAIARINTAFNGGNSDAVLIVGDGGDTNRFVEAGNINEHTAGVYLGAGVGIDNAHLYTADDTIDVVFTDDTNNDGSAGNASFGFAIARIPI